MTEHHTEFRKAQAADLQAHQEWRAWGEQFGWRLYGSNGPYAADFATATGEHIYMIASARSDIDRVLAMKS